MSKLIKDSFYIKIVFVIVGLFATIPFVYQQIEGGIKILLLWSIVVLGYTLWKNWSYLKTVEYILLMLFTGSYVITIAMNIGKRTMEEIMLLAYTGVFLFLLTYCDRRKTKEDIKREIIIIFRCIVAITMLFAAICLVMFVFSLDGTFKLKDIKFPYGMWEGRLWGLYNPNTGGVLNYISLIMSMILLRFSDIKNYEKKLLYCNIVMQGICFILAQSRGAEVSFFAYIIIYILFIRKEKVSMEDKKKKYRNKIVIAYCTIAVISFTSDVATSWLGYIPSTVSNIICSKEEKIEKKNVKRKEKKDKSIASETTGRSGMWELGAKIFIDHPIVGVGSQSITDQMKDYFEEDWYKNSKGGGLHNVYVTILASCGALGAIFIFIFFGRLCIKGLKFLLNNRRSTFEKCLITFLPAWMIGDLVETRIILTTSFFAMLFWIIVGYTLYYLYQSEKEERFEY